MKTFLAVYVGSMAGEKMAAWHAQDEATRKKRETAAMEAWMSWGKKHASAIVDQGGPLGKTKLANAKGVSDIKNLMTGYVIVRAESHEAAAQMFVEHPHFTMFPGEGVEIVEVMPIPRI